MTQEQHENATPAATERAEQILSRAGERLGKLVGRAGQRLQQTAQAFREEADQMDDPGSTSTHPRSRASTARKAPANQPTTARAEELVGQLEQRFNRWALVNGAQAKRAIARLREDAEDMWIEAQELRTDWRGTRR